MRKLAVRNGLRTATSQWKAANKSARKGATKKASTGLTVSIVYLAARRNMFPVRAPYFDCATFNEVMPLVLNHHYAKRRCADPTAVFVMRAGNYEPLACAIFAAPANKYFGSRAVELVRLVRKPEYKEPLSAFIAKCIGELKREKRFYYVLAYADTDADHHGGIYQACSFFYIGLSKGHRMYRMKQADDLFGERTTRTISARSRDQSSDSTKSAMEAFSTGPKHLYVKGLLCSTTHIVERLGRKRLPYPKPDLTGATDTPAPPPLG